jgi:hypothetical protein
MRKILVEYLPGLIGGVVGGVLGFYVFRWLLVNYSLFAPVLPGAFTGLLCGLLSRTDSRTRGFLCGLEAMVAGIVSEWILFQPPFPTDGSLLDYVAKCYQLPLPTLLLLGLGTILGFWWGKECSLRGRLLRDKPVSQPTEEN